MPRDARTVLDFITPDWPAPANVRAVCTTRRGGVSRAPFDGFNLAGHVGDDPQAVAANRRLLRDALELPRDPVWLNQVHGTQVVAVQADAALVSAADGAYATRPQTACAVLTADCLPVLFCDRAGTQVAAAHAGWRGLAAGVLEKSVGALSAPRGQLMAWLGPAIGPRHFQVGGEVRQAFVEQDTEAAAAFRPEHGDRWLADLYHLARRRLENAGLTHIYGGEGCTYADAERFYSYRRDGVTGRMASLIWLAAP